MTHIITRRPSKLEMQPLALLGGPAAVEACPEDEPLFHWPIVTREDQQAVWDVMASGKTSGTEITQQFEAEYAAFNGSKYALAHCNGTMALQTAMWAVGLRRGDEMLCPAVTYWASALPAYGLGVTPLYVDVDPQTMTIDPAKIEARIGPRTKALMVVHYCGHPCDMDPIRDIVDRHGLWLLEDVSHAQGALYKGQMCGTFGDAAAMSMMGAKSFPVGEGGMLLTDKRSVYEAAIVYSHYERIMSHVTTPALKAVYGPEEFKCGLPAGGVKGRMNQMCSAFGRVQLRHYPDRIAVIQSAMNRFWDVLAGTPGIGSHRPSWSNSTKGGWYNPVANYIPEELGGLPVERFIEALEAEGVRMSKPINFPLHRHPVSRVADIYGDGKPTRVAFAGRDMREPDEGLPVSESLQGRAVGVPWFKHDQPDRIEQYAMAYRKVAAQAEALINPASARTG